LPFDVSEEDLFLPQVELAKVVARLDRNGWAGQHMYRATFHRALQLLAKNREEILEISLGVDALFHRIKSSE
jgi:hypothetical protein